MKGRRKGGLEGGREGGRERMLCHSSNVQQTNK